MCIGVGGWWWGGDEKSIRSIPPTTNKERGRVSLSGWHVAWSSNRPVSVPGLQLNGRWRGQQWLGRDRCGRGIFRDRRVLCPPGDVGPQAYFLCRTYEDRLSSLRSALAEVSAVVFSQKVRDRSIPSWSSCYGRDSHCPGVYVSFRIASRAWACVCTKTFQERLTLFGGVI